MTIPAARVGLGCSLRALPEVRGGEAAFFSLKKYEVLAPMRKLCCGSAVGGSPGDAC